MYLPHLYPSYYVLMHFHSICSCLLFVSISISNHHSLTQICPSSSSSYHSKLLSIGASTPSTSVLLCPQAFFIICLHIFCLFKHLQCVATYLRPNVIILYLTRAKVISSSVTHQVGTYWTSFNNMKPIKNRLFPLRHISLNSFQCWPSLYPKQNISLTNLEFSRIRTHTA